MDNPFIKRQMDARLEAERDMIVLYAESCFLNIQVLSGNLFDAERLEQLAGEMRRVEHRLRGMETALLRIGVSPGDICYLSEQERMDLFERHFAEPETLAFCFESSFGQEELRDMLSDLYSSMQAEAIT